MSSGRIRAAVVVALWVLAILILCPVVAVGETAPSSYWRDSIDFPDDPFCNMGGYMWDISWIKFTILLSEPDRVYFQDSNEYLFHYDFGVEFLGPLLGMSLSEFDAVTLYEAGQEAVLGTVLMRNEAWISGPEMPEYAIQFVRHDPIDPEEIVAYFELVRSKVNSDPGVDVYYFPTFEQAQVAEEYADYFSSNGVEVSSADRWAEGNSCYSEGWALGTLKYFAGDEIEDVYLAGMLGPGDILMTDAVPAEIPYLAGIISLSASTPNSHVTLLSQSYSIPFVHAVLEEDVARAQSLVGRTVVLRAYGSSSNCSLDLIDVEDELTLQQMEEILALKSPADLDIAPMATLGAYSANADGLTQNDVRYFGGKASNYGFLRRSIPNESPVAMALSFDVWNEFMGQVMPGGLTLGEEIDSVLSGYSYPPDFSALADDLDDIRDLIKDDDETHFSAGLRAAILTALQDPQYGFDPNKKIRFRSSTNVEDTEQFVGAGLYDSYSGCLADDVDGDTIGPSICEPEESKERGVFRAIRKVFASFYNDNAFLERLRRRVDESDVGMAVLVHHSFPDEIELANGVATSEAIAPFSLPRVDHLMVTQKGAVSIANPEGDAVPEEVTVEYEYSIPSVVLKSPSSLVPLGDSVLAWQQDYIDLAGLFTAVAEAYGSGTGKSKFVLDYEYKKVAPGGGAHPDGGLVVKQVREIPQVSETSSIVPFLVNQPIEFETFQGDDVNVFCTHRLKSRIRLTTDNLWMTLGNLGDCFFADTWMEYMADGQLYEQRGELSTWSGATHAYDGAGTAIDGWQFDHLANPRSYELTARNIPTLVSASGSPLVTLEGVGGGSGPVRLELTVHYRDPVPIHATSLSFTTVDISKLVQSSEPDPSDVLCTLSLRCADDVVIRSMYYVSLTGGSPAIGNLPLRRFVETRIEGVTTEPLVLTGYYAQSFHARSHNMIEEFIFEPRLDSGTNAQQLAELAAADVRMIHVTAGVGWSQSVAYYGTDDVRREQLCWECGVNGDLDCDGDVDLDDYSDWADCMTGPGGTASLDCLLADVDDDGDVDLADFAQMEMCASGDMNCDGMLDEADVELWDACMTGPDITYPVYECRDRRHVLADFDNDRDVDLQDFAVFTKCFAEWGS